MSLSRGTRLGPYEIVSPLGAGGMGEVYTARDTRLERTVAVKVLPERLSSDEQLRARFEREAKTVSSLNHPHICTVHDVGREGETDFLVMELLEGESLSSRLERGPLAVEDALRYAIQIADALEKAHRHGVIHRDLKPGNVMLTATGAKLLDFGLAKATGPATGESSAALSSLPTQQRDLTEAGTVLGTFQYMAPEQLEGGEADARTDIFAFGALLFEMLTGRKAFSGKSKMSLVAAILEHEPPPVSTLQPLSPPALERLIRTCLHKSPEERWQTAHDLKLQLRWIEEGGSEIGLPAPVTARRKRRERLAWAVAALALLATAGASIALWSSRQPPLVVRSSLLPPEGARFEADSGAMALSPDGQRVAFIASRDGEPSMLWVRSLSALTAQPLAGTEEARFPFWSPDSRFIGFFSKGKLRKIDAAGGPPQALCDAPNARGGSWGTEGTILFTPSPRSEIYRVGAGGGTSVKVTAFDEARGETTHRHPEFLPDGRHFLFLVEGKGELTDTVNGFSLFAASLDEPGKRFVVATNASARYARSGQLLFRRDRSLVAQRFDAETLTLSGDAIPLAESVLRTNRWEAIFSVSRTGLLAFQGGAAREESRLVWLDREGRETGRVASERNYSQPKLSPDGRRVAVQVLDAEKQQEDVWVIDVERGTSTRLTFDPADDIMPVWSPDGRSVYFTGQRTKSGDIYTKSAAGTGEDRLVYAGESVDLLGSVSSDGRTAWVASQGGPGSFDIHRVDLGTGKAEPFLQSPFGYFWPRVSPDNRFLAYNSNESGEIETYVRALGDEGGRWQISTSGGRHPVWARGGRELLFETLDRRLMAVEVTVAPSFAAGIPRALFELPDSRSGQWDVTADGQRFLVNRPVQQAVAEPITLVQNWVSDLAAWVQ